MTSTVGGVGLHAYYLATYLNRDEFDVEVAFGPGYPLDRSFLALDVPVHLVHVSRNVAPLTNIRGFLQVLRLCRSGNYDVILLGASIAGFIGRIAGWLAGVPNRVMVVHIFGSQPHQSTLGRITYRFVERGLDGLTTQYIAVSEAMRRFGEENRIIRRGNVQVIHNAIRREEIGAIDVAALRRELGLRENSRVIGTVGRCAPAKAFHYFLQAAALLKSDHPDAEFLLVGDGPLLQELKDHAQELGITDVVHFLGWRDDVHRVLCLFDICALSSLWESFGLVLVEAMSLAIPCVGTRVEGIPEVIADGETGLLVPPGDPKALASAFARLLDDPALAARMGTAGLHRYEAMFTVERMVHRYEDAMKDMVPSFLSR